MRRVLVTGSRSLDNAQPVCDAIWAQYRLARGNIVVIHGDCPTGADRFARDLCELAGIPQERYPADWDQYGKAAGPIRNGHMVSLGADVCLAFIRPGSKGTVDCVQRAKAAGIPIVHG